MYRYIKFYKPFEVLCQFTPSAGRRTLKDFISLPGVYPAGRLDYRSEGLLVLTDDGLLIQRLTDPRYTHTKTYLVQVEGVVTPQSIERLNTEMVLPNLQTRLPFAQPIANPEIPPRSKPVRDYHPTSWLKITLLEGKKHQVRRMTATVGFPTLRLIRIAIGNLAVSNMQPGEWHPLTNEELCQLQSTNNGLHSR